MHRFESTDTVGSVVTRQPALSRVFDEAGIDYCCGGKRTVRQACVERGLDVRPFLERLHVAAVAAEGEPMVDAAGMSLGELADHIEQTHHRYLRAELPRLDALAEKVLAAHGRKDPRLSDVRDTMVALVDELTSHMLKEEKLLFPMVRQLEADGDLPSIPCGTLAHPIRQMELEHDEAGSALERLRELTDAFTPPEWACNTHRALLDALAQLERDMHQHVHKENNVLFPRALELEERQHSTALEAERRA